MTNFPQVLLRDLPLSPGAATPFTLVAVDGNRNSVRVPAEVLTADSVKWNSTPPASLNAEGTEGSISVSCPSLYSYYNGQWGASPRYTKNLDDLSADMRFLLTNKEMTLTSAEQSNVKTSLGITVATANTAGLVYGSAPAKDGMAPITVEDGRMYIRNATAVDTGVVATTGEEGPVTTKTYVDTQIAGVSRELIIPAATTTTLGGVLSGGDGDIFTVSENGAVTIRQAAAGTGVPGIVTVAEANVDAQLDFVVSLRLLRSVVEGAVVNPVAPATYTQSGIVKPVGSASGPSGALYFTDNYGTLDVAIADDTKHGVVKTVSTIPDAAGLADTTTVPNTGAVRSYVQAAITGGGESGTISPSMLPKATTGALGGVIVGSRLTVDAAGVINAPIASTAENGYGVTKLSTSYTTNSSTMAATSSAVYNAYNALNNALTTLRNTVSSLQSRVATLEEKVKALEGN